MSVKCITIVSGGADSVTLAYLLKEKGYLQTLVSFSYGQRHSKELTYAAYCGMTIGCKHLIINLPIGDLLSGSSLTDSSVEVPHGHYAAETMKATVVPNRNMIMLSVAAGLAVAEGAKVIACGVHAGDHAIYPDCRPEFINSIEKTIQLANALPSLRIETPFIGKTKADIVKIGTKLKVPYESTWTCYEGGRIACGRCGTCVERLASFSEAGVEDPIEYKDREFWKEAVQDFEKLKGK